MLYSLYNQNDGKISLIKNYNNYNLQLKHNYLQDPKNNVIYNINTNNDLNSTNYKRLTANKLLNDSYKPINQLFFENSYNENNNRRKNLQNNSLKIPKNKSNNYMCTQDGKNQEMILINNGIIRNMVINNRRDKNYYSKMNFKQNNINYKNDISDDNLHRFNYSYYKRKQNNNIYNLTQNYFNENNNKYIKEQILKKYINNNNQNNNPNGIMTKNIDKRYNLKSNYNKKRNIKIIPHNNKILNQKYNIQNYNVIKYNTNNNYNNISINQKLYNKKKHYYSGSNINNNNIQNNKDRNALEDLSLIPLPLKYMKKNSFEPKNIYIKNNLLKHQSYNKIISSKNKQKIINNNYDEALNTISSDELSLLADDIINKFQKKKRIKTPTHCTKKYDINNSGLAFNKINNAAKINTNQNISINANETDIKNAKKGKINSLIIPMNINNFIIHSKDHIKNNGSNMAFKNIGLKKNINKNKKIFSAITQNKINKEYEVKNQEKNNNIINNNNNIPNPNKNINNLFDYNNLKNGSNKNIKYEKEEKRNNSESNDEDLNLIEQIVNNAENEEKNKKNRHINFNLDNNIYIYYKSKDLITKKKLYKGTKKIEITDKDNNNDDKKMDIYYALLKSKTKFNPIIKAFNKNEIKVNKEYELNENLEEYEILGDLYNIFYSKDINELEDKLKITIDTFMKDKK